VKSLLTSLVAAD